MVVRNDDGLGAPGRNEFLACNTQTWSVLRCEVDEPKETALKPFSGFCVLLSRYLK